MIVTSQTCFLNIVTQLYPKDVLTKASYYIADLTGPGGMSHLNPDRLDGMMMTDEAQYKYDEEGKLVKVGNPISVDTMQKYHITYTSGALNPTALMTSLKVGADDRKASPELRFIRSLQNTESGIEIYRELFYHKPRGNGLQILIYTNDSLCCQFGWITCEYLSTCFGADIKFIDAKFRKKISPNSRFEYIGNKQNAVNYITRIRDEELIDSFRNNLTHSNLTECMNNITTKLSMMTFEQLIHLHNILFPMNMLPQGNYTVEQLKEIIIHKCMQIRKPTALDRLDNLYAADAFYQLANEYDL